MSGEAPFESLGIQSFEIPFKVIQGVRPVIPDS